VLNLDGKGKNIPDDAVINRIKSLKKGSTVRTYISLSCTNCPDVVQALNLISILNPEIKHEIVDGAINQEEASRYNVQAVPSVFIEDKLIHVGKASLGEMIDKLSTELGVDADQIQKIKKEYDLIVVGGGPSGVSSAIYSARKGLNVAVVAQKIGGQVLETVDIENVISVPQTTGATLAADLKRHAKEYSIDLLENRNVDQFELLDGQKIITTSLNEVITAPALIVATGASWRRLNIPGESKYIGSGVAFCTHCDGPFYKDKRVAVIGGGNSGLEAAIDLSSIAKEVTVVEFMPDLKGDQVLQKKLAGYSNVRILKNTQSLEINGDGAKVTGLQIRNRTTGEEELIELDGVFVQIGLSANSDIFKDHLSVNRIGEIEVDAHCRTNVPGVYAAGDVTTVPFKQIII
ncbi:MAG: alkyl hydroperoxide reductase subunit F, partial [Bacteroidales bacterium]